MQQTARKTTLATIKAVKKNKKKINNCFRGNEGKGRNIIGSSFNSGLRIKRKIAKSNG
jgi:hypothetical protein